MEERVLEFIKEFINEHGYSPSFREIGDGCGISSTSVVAFYIEHLERSGLITREKGKSRTVRIKETENEGVL